MLTILDEYTRECLASVVARRIRSQDVRMSLAELFLSRGIPTPIRADHGLEFIARKRRHGLKALEGTPRYSAPGSPGENGEVELCHGKRREQWLNGERCDPLTDAPILTERWRTHSNRVRPHRSLGGRPPAPDTIQLASGLLTW
jgi:transposase InsO family protein